MSMSLDTMTLWPFRYTVRCDARDDLDSSLGTLPDYSLYIGSSNNVSQRLCFHFQDDDHGTQFTKRFQPRAVDKLRRMLESVADSNMRDWAVASQSSEGAAA